MSNIITASASSTSSTIVSNNHFGGNILFHRDRVADGTFDDAVEGLGVTQLRYPGGAITEQYFDINDPNATTVAHVSEERELQLLPLSDFLRFSHQESLGVSIVLPTRHALLPATSGTRQVNADFIAETKAFVSRVLNGEFGSGDIRAFEIGNEYWGSGQMTAIEYGKVADAISITTQEAIDEYQATNPLAMSREEPKIIVQFGQWGAFSSYASGLVQNLDIINGLSEIARAAIDGVSAHYYHRHEYERVSENSWLFNRLHRWVEEPGLEDVEFHITEWNINSSVGQEFGIRQASGILALFQRMIDEGVDAAQIWPIQQNNRTELFGDEGSISITPAGLLFQQLSSKTLGMKSLEVTTNDSDVVFNTFVSEETAQIFVHSQSGEKFNGEFDIKSIVEKIGNKAMISSIEFINSRQSPGDPNSIGVLDTFSDIGFNRVLENSTLQLSLAPFEIASIRIERVVDQTSFHNDSGQSGSSQTTFGGSGGNIIEGSMEHNAIFSGSGNDTITSSWGTDEVHSGAGNDTVMGGWRDDEISGGDGNDYLDGGWGDDILNGGQGDDTITGGWGDDLIRSGGGHDEIYGGWGNDEIHAEGGEVIINAKSGDDIIFIESGSNHITLGEGFDEVWILGTHGTVVTITDFNALYDSLYVDGISIVDLLQNSANDASGSDEHSDSDMLEISTVSGNEIHISGLLDVEF